MAYIACLHCEKPLTGNRRYCSTLCKSAEAKRQRHLRTVDDAYWATISSQPTFELTDVQCFAIEAKLAADEAHVFDGGRGFGVKDPETETGVANNDLHDSWNDRGADLDVWRLRRLDRARFGGIVMTPELETEQYYTLSLLANVQFVKWAFEADPDDWTRKFDGLDSPGFHLKTFAFEVDELHDQEAA